MRDIEDTYNPPIVTRVEKAILHEDIVKSIMEIGDRIRRQMNMPKVESEEVPLDISKCDV